MSLHPSCGLGSQPEWVIFNEFATGTYIRTVTEICPEWLLELAANYYNLASFPKGEAKQALQLVSEKHMGQNAKATGSTSHRRRKK